MITTNCLRCGTSVTRAGQVPAKYCSKQCADDARRDTKPVNREWLHQKYVVENLGTVQIGKIVGRHPKRVYEWLVGYGIPTREKWRGNVPKPKPYHDRDWLAAEYARGGNVYTIAESTGASPSSVFRYLKRFGIETRTTEDSRLLSGKPFGLKGEKNGMFGRKGSRAPNWKGGATPERQAFYQTREWALACSVVWDRDEATCRRCHARKTSEDQKYCVHHIVSFAVKTLRAEVSNLILLCDACHRWVHSGANANREYIEQHERGDHDPPR